MLRRQLLTALVTTVVLIVGFGFVYPAVVWAISQVAFKSQANGSLVSRDGTVVGSSLIGQLFSAEDGSALKQYFQPRPSAAGDGYDAGSSGASNLGPLSEKLLAPCLPVPAVDEAGYPVVDASGNPLNRTGPDGGQVCDGNTVPQRAIAYRRLNGLPDRALVPVDAVTASASGLDPDISPANALDQAPRVASARGLAVSRVVALVHTHIRTRPWGFLGENTVNVLELNLALDHLG